MNNIKRSFKKLHLKKNLIKFSSFVFSLFLIFSSFNFSFAYQSDDFLLDRTQYSVVNFVNKTSYYDASYGVYGMAYYFGAGYSSDYPIYSGNTYLATIGQNQLVFAIEDAPSPSDFPAIIYSYKYNSTNTVTSSSSYVYNASSDLFYTTVTTDQSFVASCPNYNDISSALSGIRNYIDISSVPPTTYPFTFQNGYLLVIDLGQSGTSFSYSLSSKSEEYSNIGSNPFPDTNQSYWFEDSLPELDETTIPSSSAISIQWVKGDKTNIFGQTQDMVSTLSGTSSARYLYIYNPPVHYKWSGSSNPTASEVINYPVTLDGFTENSTFYVYDSYARLTDFSQGGRVVATVTGDQGVGVVSDGAISVTTTDGAIFEQNSGGSTDISGANGGSISENIAGLKDTLDKFVNSFISLLSAPISHIQQLISAGQSFFDVFIGLFSWLPSELTSVMLSALVVMVVIGVLKMLL